MTPTKAAAHTGNEIPRRSAARTPRPLQVAPELVVPLVSGGSWNLAEAKPRSFTMIIFYRGNHCPVCRAQLTELNRRLDEIEQRGIEVIAISGDTETLARKTVEGWHLDRLQIGFGLDTEAMRRWGLFVSKGHDGEPAWFSEPGLFLISPDGAVYYEALNSMPWGRPRLDDVLNGLDFVISASYPARGEA
jgi:peroxiredoxin